MRRRHYKAGDIIFKEGDPADEAYIIHSGWVEILKETPGGPSRLAILGDDDVVGEMGLLEERPRSATARAGDDVVASSVNHDEFIDLILNEPQEGLSLLRALFERLRTMNQMVTEMQAGQEVSNSLNGAGKLPKVMLYAASEITEDVVPKDGLRLTRFPYKIGRLPLVQESGALAFNDLSLKDPKTANVSLNHCALDLEADGVVVRDRGSRESTRVNGIKIGARAFRQSARLNAGDNELVLGTTESPYRFRVVLGA